jgi:thiosulfate reductase/polysulfide reductase chain A
MSIQKQQFDPSRRAFLGATMGGTALSIAGFPSQALARINAPHDKEKLKETTSVFGFCDMCYWRCGLKIRSRDGRAVKIEGNPEHPNNWGVVCAKGNSGLMVSYAPNRLKFPMKRVGERGEGKWERITWDEALDTVAKEMKKAVKKYGPQTVSLIGHGSWEKPYHRLFHALGTPNYASPMFGLCCGPRGISNMLLTGRNLTGNETYDLENCKFFLMMGRNVTESLHNGETLGWLNGVANGAKVVYLDPRYSITASKADEYHAIRPLTDQAFLLAMIHVVVNEELYDKKFVAENTTGLEQLKQQVQKYTPEWAAPITEISADDIRRISREMAAKAPSVLVYAPRRMTRSANDLGMGLCVAVLNSLFGVWNRKGGVFTPQKYKVPEIDLPEFKNHAHVPKDPKEHPGTDFKQPFVADQSGKIYRADGVGVPGRWYIGHPKLGLVNELWKSIGEQKPYPLKVLLTAGGNAFMNGTDYEGIRKGLMALDFYVAADVIPNEMNMYADILLPEASYLERYDDLQVGGGKQGYVAVRMPAMKPLHDTRDAWTICKQLANRLDLGAYFPHDSIKELLEDRMKKAGSSLAEIEQKGILKTSPDDEKNFPGEYGIKTEYGPRKPSGEKVYPDRNQIELVSSMLPMLRKGDPFEYVEQPRPKAGEFHLTLGRIGFHTHARTQDNIWTADLMKENVLWIHPEAAEKRGIKSGDRLKVTDTKKGRTEHIKAKVTPRIRKDTVFMVHGFGHFDKRMTTAYAQGASDSNLASDDQDPYIGSVGMGKSFVKVEKV